LSPALMASSVVLRRGDALTVTPEILEASRDQDGRSWLDLLDDEPGQIARWGRVQVRRGPATDDLAVTERGTPEHREAREEARRAAWALGNSQERWQALRDVERIYGPAE